MCKNNYKFKKKNGSGAASYKRIKLCTNAIACTKINLKWIIDLNVRAKIIKLLEENTRLNLNYLESGNSFLDMTPKA